MRRAVLIAWTVAVLVGINFAVVERETIRREGRRVLLRLAPVDPRSLMQGDYMVLRYELARHVPDGPPGDGVLVVKIGTDDVAAFGRLHDGAALIPGEHLLKFRRRHGDARIGAESYFFQEGQAGLYASARYGDLRVSSTGDVVLVGLVDENLKPLGSDSP